MGDEVRIEFEPPSEVAGQYANIVRVWHTPFEFTLDFGVAGEARATEDGYVVSVPTVARVKIPTSVIFELARAIADNVARYESNYGAIAPSGNAPRTPGDLGGDQ
jgi:hypothetical protein